MSRGADVMRRRILHCIPTMEGGGAERQLAYLCQGLSQLGWRVHVALFQEGPNIQRLRKSGAVIHRLHSAGNHDPTNLLKLLMVVRKVRPTLVQTWLPMMDAIGGLACASLGIPHILSERNSKLAYAPTWKTKLREYVGARAQAIISNSSDGDKYWQEKLGDAPTRRFVIPNSVPFHEISRIEPANAATLGIPSDSRIVVYAGRYEAQKNVENLALAMCRVLQSANVFALFFGEGPLRDRLVRIARENGLSSRMLVQGYRSNIWAILKRANVFVSVSHHEGMPNTVMEAMACGCPVVASDIPEHRAMLDGSCAILVSRNEPASIATGIDLALNSNETSNRAQIALQRAREWSVDAMVRRYVETYEQIVS